MRVSDLVVSFALAALAASYPGARERAFQLPAVRRIWAPPSDLGNVEVAVAKWLDAVKRGAGE